MGQAEGNRDERPGPAPESFEVFYLREYPQVVGLLQGLLGRRLVAEELAQETFLVAYRDWDRISRLHTRARGSARWR
jgi:DNA-directed RNA polymerase specialized sigma24 family protein